eukprot:gene10657-12399_t
MLLTSFKTPEDISTGNLLSWPTVITGIGWVKAWATVDGYFWNSIKITVPAVLISTAIGALNGYVLSMWRFRGSQLFFGLLLFGCFLPFQTVLLPASFTLGKMGLASTTTGLVFVHIVYGLAFTTLFFRNYYVSIPDALVKAARLDGAGFFTIFRLIILPMSTPIIMVCLIWQFTQIWNDFLFGVVFSSGDSQPITVALNNLVNTSTGVKEYNVDMAAAMIAGLPTLLVYVVAGKYFVRGLTAGATYGTGLPDTLKNIELSIKEGEFLILVGPSGCGKSTLMNCIAGLENITGGAIMIGDQDDGRLVALLDSGQARCELPLNMNDAGLEDREVILGLRPEQIVLAAAEATGAPTIRAEVQVTEPTGPDTLVFVQINDTKVCCRLAPDVAPQVGETLTLQFDPAKVLLFDAKTGERLGTAASLPAQDRADNVAQFKGR